jgi:hypothetical protein
MGVFVGSITTIVLKFIDSSDDWRKSLAVLLPAVFSGVTAAFFKDFDKSAVACYPVGLVIGLMWNYMYIAKENIADVSRIKKFIGWVQMIGTGLLTVIALWVVAGHAYEFASCGFGDDKACGKLEQFANAAQIASKSAHTSAPLPEKKGK